MKTAVIASYVRTPLCKSWRGALNDTHGAHMAGHVIHHAVDRAGIEAGEVEDVLLGCAMQEGATGYNVARQAALRAGSPVDTAAATINRFCASGLQSIASAAYAVACGQIAVGVAGGVESISLVQTAHKNLHRREDDWLARTSARPVHADARHRRDRGPALPRLARGPGCLTAGNASQFSDGAAACVVMDAALAERRGIEPLGWFRGFATAGCEPDEMGIGPVFAVPRLLERFGLKVSDIDLWELNEAFASQALYCRDKLGIDPAKYNVNGGAISIGHPYGMTGMGAARGVGHALIEGKRRGAR
jgi:acetyl-CoA C-acetyltransferase